MHATAVIGTNFGDEGKGLVTDFLCAGHPGDTTVVRFSGGAQAGHTVVTPDGRRHVFHHFGSGTLAGAPTYLSRFFIVNPLLWKKEYAELCAMPGAGPTPLMIDPDAPLTTPYDMLMNQEFERTRQDRRHGSCGVGINETIERNSRGVHSTCVRDIQNPARLRALLELIRSEYVLPRLAELGIDPPSDWFLQLLRSDRLLESFLQVAAQFLDASVLRSAEEALRTKHVVFEGAQGLLLDENHRFFPHVTRSRTGIHNACLIAGGVGITDLDVIYVTRAYMTRHGSGPFPTEDPALRYADSTNEPHEFQGRMRFGILDVGLLAQSIRQDIATASGVKVNPRLAITCLDQIGPEVTFRLNQTQQRSVPEMLESITGTCEIEVAHLSYGPSRSTIADTPRSTVKPSSTSEPAST